MPIHDLGYRAWQGRKSSRASRWLVIATGGIHVVWRNMWLRRMMLVAWLPATYVGVGLFGFEYYLEQVELTDGRPGQVVMDGNQFEDPRRARQLIRRQMREGGIQQALPLIFMQMFSVLSDGDVVRDQILYADDPQQSRHTVWAWFLMLFFRYPQGFLMLLVVGMIAPPLIARDVRSKGFLLYFSRPLSPLEYLLAKASVVWFFLAWMTTVPALALYLIGILVSPSLDVAWDTWDLPLRIVAASFVLMVPTTGLALVFSSLASESRFAGFAWFAVWALGWIAYLAVATARMDTQLDPRWTVVSLYHTLGSVQRWIFGIETSLGEIWYSVAILAAVTVASIAILVRRVSAPIRI